MMHLTPVTVLSAAAEESAGQPVVLWNLVLYLTQKLGLGDGSAGRYALIIGGALLSVVLSYLIGSVSPAILLSTRKYGKDVRTGEERIAEATAMRTMFGWKPALLTLLCDAVKTAAAIGLGVLLFGVDGGALAGFFVVFGHLFPVYHRFQGGNGLVCLFAAALCINPLTFAILVGIFLIVLIGTRFLSLATVMTAMLYPLILRAFTDSSAGLTVAMAVLTMVFVIIRHKDNLSRIWNGREPKIRLPGRRNQDKEDPK